MDDHNVDWDVKPQTKQTKGGDLEKLSPLPGLHPPIIVN